MMLYCWLYSASRVSGTKPASRKNSMTSIERHWPSHMSFSSTSMRTSSVRRKSAVAPRRTWPEAPSTSIHRQTGSWASIPKKPSSVTPSPVRSSYSVSVFCLRSSELLRRQNTDTEYEDLTVEGVTLDGFFGIDAQEPVCLWIDVEGASGHVLRGATALLRRTELVLIEVEEKLMWEGQWRSIDVIEFFLDAGFVPLTRDAEYNQQYNIIFVREDVYERPDVLWSHELHTNYLTQHMGVT